MNEATDYLENANELQFGAEFEGETGIFLHKRSIL